MAFTWETGASLATAAGTLVLAVATFASVRSGRDASRTAERALLAGLRPLLLPSRRGDEDQKIRFGDGKWVKLAGQCGTVELGEEAIYLAASIRNAGQGIAVIHGWYPVTGSDVDSGSPDIHREHAGIDDFRRQSRDMYVPGGDCAFWQAAVRDRADVAWDALEKQVRNGEPVTVDVLYGDYEGGQRTITRLLLTPFDEGRQHLVSTTRHWNIDRADPR